MNVLLFLYGYVIGSTIVTVLMAVILASWPTHRTGVSR